MISPAIINSVKNSVCAIGYFSQDPDAWYREAQRDAQKEGGKVDLRKLPKQMVGSGFLVSDTVVLSNRHVADALRITGKPINWWFMSFIVPTDGGWSERGFRMKKAMMASWQRLDTALFEFEIAHDMQGAEGLRPVQFGSLDLISVGRPIAMCGYLGGDALLDLSQFEIQRFGPVLHQGYISALAPHEAVEPRDIVSFLTDIGAGRGFSGSPVFLPDDGSVIGLHFAGNEGQFGLALPVDGERVAGWLTAFEKVSAGAPVMVTGSNTGDVDVIDALPPEIFQRVKNILNKARLGGENRAKQENEAVRVLMENDPELDEPTAMEFVQRLTDARRSPPG